VTSRPTFRKFAQNCTYFVVIAFEPTVITHNAKHLNEKSSSDAKSNSRFSVFAFRIFYPLCFNHFATTFCLFVSILPLYPVEISSRFGCLLVSILPLSLWIFRHVLAQDSDWICLSPLATLRVGFWIRTLLSNSVTL
jgi:hypothetical protein